MTAHAPEPRSSRAPVGRDAGLGAGLAVSLVVCAIAAARVGRGLYADGAHYLAALASTGAFFHVAQTRIGATLLTQWPVVAAVQWTSWDLATLARLQTLALFGPPVLLYGVAGLRARPHPRLVVAHVLVVLAGFFPASTLVMGEFHVAYAAFWCAWVLLSLEARPRGTAAIVFGLSCLLVAAYEVTALLAPILASRVLVCARGASGSRARLAWSASLLPLSVSTAVGAWGALHPRDAANAAGFAAALTSLLADRTMAGLLGILALAVAVAMVPPRWRPAAWLVLLVACAGHARFLLRHVHGPLLGPAFAHRAHALAAILTAVAISVSARVDRVLARSRSWRPLWVPVLLVVAFDLADTRGWQSFGRAFCAALEDPSGASARALPQREVGRRYGREWEYPTLSALLRSAGSTARVEGPERPRWSTPDPERLAPALDARKHPDGLCTLFR